MLKQLLSQQCKNELHNVIFSTACVGQKEFHDQYFDNPTFNLTLKDFWLRKRKGCWELKCPVTKVDQPNTGQSKADALCTRYKEITDVTEIQKRLKEVLKEKESPQPSKKAKKEQNPDELVVSAEDVYKSTENDSWMSDMNLVCFAEYTTVRRSFTLEEDGVQVDLDQADFGYSVGEIEVLVSEGKDVQFALEKIEKAAQKLGLTGNQRIPGKMDVYLQRYLPKHYETLIKAHIL